MNQVYIPKVAPQEICCDSGRKAINQEFGNQKQGTGGVVLEYLITTTLLRCGDIETADATFLCNSNSTS
jgi:hypothetical protein